MSHATAPFILLVDDNPTNLSVLSSALKAAGYKVRMAADGEDALAQVDRARPELILLDVQMPKLDGFATCQRLQANPATAGIPVIFMTALADTENKLKGLSLGAVDYITKPFEQAEVLARVKVHWRLKQLTDSLEQQVMQRSQALQQAQIQLIQQEKLSTLGQLIAGIGHEINNPLGCIASNLAPAQQYLTDLTTLLNLYQQHYPEPPAAIADEIAAIDPAFVLKDFALLLDSMNVASDRIKDVSESLRKFSRVDGSERTTADLHEGLDSTLLLLQHRLKATPDRPAIQVIKHYGTLPKLQCYPNQLNQVFMNILANAIDMFDEIAQTQSFEDLILHPQLITLRTENVDHHLHISIQDNGKGIDEAVQSRIFDYLFTTKAVGKGTGLGLAIAHQIVVEKHHGTIHVDSGLGQGSTFTLRLPIPD
jgi:signal transduction histidine kinase